MKKYLQRCKYSDCVNELLEIEIESVYHFLSKVTHGEEIDKTFFQYKNKDKGYHIDYIFSYKNFILNTLNFEIKKFEEWIEYSDHVPLLWEFTI
jgi:exonuclease III